MYSCFHLSFLTNINLSYTDDRADDEEDQSLGLADTIVSVGECGVIYVHRCEFGRSEGIAVGQGQVNVVDYEAAGNAKEYPLYEI